jgi:hypothetical protein
MLRSKTEIAREVLLGNREVNADKENSFRLDKE